MDIVSLPIPVDENKIDSRFRLVILATERAKQLMSGAKLHVSTGYIKPTTMALEELAECNVEYLAGKEAKAAMEEVQRSKLLEEIGIKEELKDEKKMEIEKELGVYMHETPESESSEETEE